MRRFDFARRLQRPETGVELVKVEKLVLLQVEQVKHEGGVVEEGDFAAEDTDGLQHNTSRKREKHETHQSRNEQH